MPGWQSSTENIREFGDLPENAKKYVCKIEEVLDVPGKFIVVLCHYESSTSIIKV